MGEHEHNIPLLVWSVRVEEGECAIESTTHAMSVSRQENSAGLIRS
jgi:hypothetical protein